MGKRFALLALLCGLLLTLTPVKAQDERLQIVASFSILADVVSNVAGNAADVRSLMPAGADPHSFTPAPSDLAAVADADVVFVNGAGFEETLLEALENAASGVEPVVVSQCVEIIAFGEHDHEAEADHDHADDMLPEGEAADLCAAHAAEMAALHDAEMVDHAHGGEVLGRLYALDCGAYAEEAGDEHDHGACDPHVWQEPHNVMYWTMLIRDTLVALDPANAETYTANANAYIAQLDTLAHDFVRPTLENIPAERRVLITDHDTMGYLAAAYGFEVVGIVLPGGTAAEPSASDMAALIDAIRAEGVPAVFVGTTVTQGLAQQIADEAGAAFYTLYTDSLSDESGAAPTYIDLIRYNVETITNALAG